MGFDAFKSAAPPEGGSSQSKTAAPVSPRAANSEPDAVASAPQEPQFNTSLTPSGIGVYYSWAPRRHYRVGKYHEKDGIDWDACAEVPSVTTVLGVLDKSGPLTWWGMKVGIDGVLALYDQRVLGKTHAYDYSTEEIVAMLTEHKLTVNHVKDKAADRGVNVHGALEQWIEHGESPNLADFAEHEQGYVKGVGEFIAAIDSALVLTQCESELMVGSLEHQYAGRFDLVLTLSKPVEVVTRYYPKKPPKIEEIPAGRYLMDLKTRKKASVYDTNFLQLEAYEAAAVECGYRPTDYRAVIVVTEDGGYQLSVNKDFCFQDFLAVRECYRVMNEREILRILREELDAKEIG